MITKNDEIQDQLPVPVKPGIVQGDSKDERRLKARIEMEGFELKITPIEKGRRETAIDLIYDVFMKYEAPDYSSEGIEMFQKTAIHNQDFLDKLEMYGAYQGEHLIGVIATRSNGSHIALFFVNGKHHRQGIGRKLFQVVVENCAVTEITVNSSPFAVEVYHHLGFVDTDNEQNVNGLRFTPMLFTKSEERKQVTTD